MDRTWLLELFRKHTPARHKAGQPLSAQARAEVRVDLLAYFRSPEGQAAFDCAPSWHRARPVEQLVEDLLGEEVEFRGAGHLGRD